MCVYIYIERERERELVCRNLAACGYHMNRRYHLASWKTFHVSHWLLKPMAHAQGSPDGESCAVEEKDT